jgi:hypothetical protein
MSDNLSDLPSEFSDAGPEARSRSVSQPDPAQCRHPKTDQQDAATHPKAKGDAARNDCGKATSTTNKLPA